MRQFVCRLRSELATIAFVSKTRQQKVGNGRLELPSVRMQQKWEVGTFLGTQGEKDLKAEKQQLSCQVPDGTVWNLAASAHDERVAIQTCLIVDARNVWSLRGPVHDLFFDLLHLPTQSKFIALFLALLVENNTAFVLVKTVGRVSTVDAHTHIIPCDATSDNLISGRQGHCAEAECWGEKWRERATTENSRLLLWGRNFLCDYHIIETK